MGLDDLEFVLVRVCGVVSACCLKWMDRMVDGGQSVFFEPYQWVRHPGYLGMIFGNGAVPLLLGSHYALVLGLLNAGLCVFRTKLEDQALQSELPGYADYASQVRARLLPGTW